MSGTYSGALALGVGFPRPVTHTLHRAQLLPLLALCEALLDLVSCIPCSMAPDPSSVYIRKGTQAAFTDKENK